MRKPIRIIELCADNRFVSGANLDSKRLTRKIFRNRDLVSCQVSVLSSEFGFAARWHKGSQTRRVRRLVPIPHLEGELHKWVWKYVIAVIVVCDGMNMRFQESVLGKKDERQNPRPAPPKKRMEGRGRGTQ